MTVVQSVMSTRLVLRATATAATISVAVPGAIAARPGACSCPWGALRSPAPVSAGAAAVTQTRTGAP